MTNSAKWLTQTDPSEHERRNMSDFEAPRTYSGAFLAVIAIALLAAVGSLIWCFTLGSRLSSQQADLVETKQQNRELAAELRETDARLRVTSDELAKSLGLTQKQLDQRAQAIIAREQADNAKLESAEQQTAQQVSAVSSDLSNVKTDVGGVRTDLTKTQGDVTSALSQLESVKGDLSNTNSVIARNHDELVTLEHKGDRNYYEFVLARGQKKPVGTVSLELKKTDAKHSKFTLDIYADDKVYEKKDRNVNEPMQFYSGKDPALFEVVVNSISTKNQISGYLSSPKSVPTPPTGQ
jgi:DNA anti-recombination protein RmuC